MNKIIIKLGLALSLLLGLSIQASCPVVFTSSNTSTGNFPISVAFSPVISGNTFLGVVDNTDSDLRIYSFNSITGATSLIGAVGIGTSPQSVAFSPTIVGGNFVAITNNVSFGGVRVYSINSMGDLGSVQQLSAAHVAHVAYSPNGNFAIVGGALNLFSYAVTQSSGNFNLTNSLTVGTNTINSIAIAPSNDYTAVAGSDEVNIFSSDPNSGFLTPASTVGVSGAFGVAYHPSGNFAAVTSSTASNTVIVFSVDPGSGAFSSPQTPVPTGSTPEGVAYSPDGNFLTVGNASINGSINVYSVDSTSGALTEISGSPLSLSQNQGPVAFSPGSNFIASLSEGTNTLYIAQVFQATDTPTLTSASSDTTGLITVAGNSAVPNSTITIYDVTTSTTLGSSTADGSGNFSFAATTPVCNGNHAIIVTQTSDGCISEFSDAINVDVFLQAPVLTIACLSSSGIVEVAGNGALANAPITIFDMTTSTTIGSGTANGSGNFNFASTTPLSTNISHSIVVTQTYPDLCVSSFSNAISASAAGPILSSASSNGAGIITVIGHGAIADATIIIFDITTSTTLGTGTADGSGNFDFPATIPVSGGSHTIAVSQSVNGCTSSLSNTVIVNAILVIAQDASFSTESNKSVAITMTATSSNSFLVTFAIVSGPSHGTLSAIMQPTIGAPTQTAMVTYSPAAEYLGTDSFTFNVTNGSETSNTATITITISSPVETAPSLISAILNQQGFVIVTGNNAAPGAPISIVLNGTTIIGTGTADESGDFMFSSSTVLPRGLNLIQVTQSGTITPLSNGIVVAVGFPTPSLFIERLIEKYFDR